MSPTDAWRHLCDPHSSVHSSVLCTASIHLYMSHLDGGSTLNSFVGMNCHVVSNSVEFMAYSPGLCFCAVLVRRDR